MDPLNPTPTLLVKLGSVIVHYQEVMGPDPHEFDVAAINTLLEDPEVTEWLDGMRAGAFLPLKRGE